MHVGKSATYVNFLAFFCERNSSGANQTFGEIWRESDVFIRFKRTLCVILYVCLCIHVHGYMMLFRRQKCLEPADVCAYIHTYMCVLKPAMTADWNMHVCIYIHTCIHTYIHTCSQTSSDCRLASADVSLPLKL